MIRFRSLEISNFHLARALVIPFSLDPERPLTVIRAEPGTGKTTVFRAFRWVLYGDPGLPNDGKGYPLGSIAEEDRPDGEDTKISVTLEFEADGSSSPEVYRLTRSAYERVTASGRSRRPGGLLLLRSSHAGWMSVEHPERKVEQIFPAELRDVFFTDGDEAMRFIAKDVSTDTKRRRVQGAIRNLMGLNVLDAAIGHLGDVSSNFNSEVRAKGGQGALADASALVTTLEKEHKDSVAEAERLATLVAELEEHRSDVRQRLDAALQRGNRAELAKELGDAERSLSTAQADEVSVVREKSDLLRSRETALPFVAESLSRARKRLQSLKDDGAIPSDYLPLLRERLQLQSCVCGTGLGPGTEARLRVEELLQKQERMSDSKERLTRLYYLSDASVDFSSFVGRLRILEERRYRAQSQQEDAGARVRAAQAKIKALGETDTTQLQTQFDSYDQTLKTESRKATQAEALAQQKKKALDDAKRDLERLLASEKHAQALRTKLEVVGDLLRVLGGAKEWIQGEKLTEVSDEMDRLFRDMIGQDVEDALITRAEITPEFDVAVYARSGARLDPDVQLNGASRRAITLAFILGLAKVSGVASPNVIDTPLGMMGIQVKQSALRVLVTESAQPILFLTYAEIRDIESALDTCVGSEVTLTLTKHYPKYLANKPPTDDAVILQCACNHRGHCELCERTLTTADLERGAEGVLV